MQGSACTALQNTCHDEILCRIICPTRRLRFAYAFQVSAYAKGIVIKRLREASAEDAGSFLTAVAQRELTRSL